MSHPLSDHSVKGETQSGKAASGTEIVVSEITYGGGDIALRGILARPANDKGVVRPGILVLHGGPNSDIPQSMRWLAEALARRGFVALSGTYRHDPEKSHDAEDAALAIDFLSKLEGVDPKKIGMTGQSRGAMTSYRLSAVDPRVRAILPIASGSPERFAGFGEVIKPNPRMHSESRYMEMIRSKGGFPKEFGEGAQDVVSMIPEGAFPSVFDLRIPILVLHGTWDLHGAVDGCYLMKDAARERGAAHIRFNLVDGMGHFFETAAGSLQGEIGELAADWFDHCLLGRDAGRDFEASLSLPDVAQWPVSDRFAIREIEYHSGNVTVPGFLLEPTPGHSNGRSVIYAPDGHSNANASRLAFLVKELGESGFTVLVTRYRAEKAHVFDDDDIRAAIDFLQQSRGDAAREISLVGHVRGGMAVLRTAAKDKRPKKVVVLAAPSNVTRLIDGLQGFSRAAAAYEASRIDGEKQYRALSPQYYLHDVKVPVFLVHGSLDLMAPAEHMLWNAIGLTTTGNTSVEMYVVPWDTHYFDSPFAWMEPADWVGRITRFILDGPG